MRSFMETRIDLFTHPFANGDGFFGQGLGVRHVVLHYGLEQLIFVLPIKRRLDLQRQTEACIGLKFILPPNGCFVSTLSFSWRVKDQKHFHIRSVRVKWSG